MSAETLRKAATGIRGDYYADPLMSAVADLLEVEAGQWDYDFESYQDRHLTYWRVANPDSVMPAEVEAHIHSISIEYADGRLRPALAVARAYLGEAP